eukprot:9598368-Prorocentrum_lima.AAC.1
MQEGAAAAALLPPLRHHMVQTEPPLDQRMTCLTLARATMHRRRVLPSHNQLLQLLANVVRHILGDT